MSADEPIEATVAPRVTLVRPDFDQFYRARYPQVARALAYTLGDTDLASEATDEAMARAYSRWEKVSSYDNPAGWVYRVGLNWARSVHRRLARRLPFTPATTTDLPPIADPAIRDALVRLDVKLRSVIVCRFLLDWTVEETAAALDLNPGTVKSRQSRAVEQLATRLSHLR